MYSMAQDSQKMSAPLSREKMVYAQTLVMKWTPDDCSGDSTDHPGRGREASIKEWSHDCLALSLSKVGCNHRVFNSLVDSVVKRVPSIGLRKMSGEKIGPPVSRSL
jgi:hypothetical protein